MRTIKHNVDLCVVGGGLAGMCAAISAARHGIKVLLMHDRPVLGGNASSEIRMWVCGARGPDKKETGIIEEIMLENLYRNPNAVYSIWDSILYEKVRFEENITMLLNCSCLDAQMEGNNIKSIKGWQLTTETWHIVEAKLFADCSGDSILAPLTGAEFRIGREASSEYNESIEPEVADKKTMGLSCLLQARETDRPQKFIPPSWAYKYLTDDELPQRGHLIKNTNFWWIEIGGENDSIHDTEELRDELLKIVFGVWDHIKNHGDHGAENWILDWVGFLPGKRESRRYIGDYVLTQNDVQAEGRFEDIIAYGGWPMDDHNPAGFRYPGPPNINHYAPSPYGIPYRCLYSKNIGNLFFAGRNISTTHAALSSTRVMATCALLGQAVGTAASIAVKNNLTPRGVYNEKIEELKQTLMDDDCYLPFNKRKIPELSANAQLSASDGDPSCLRNGFDRPVEGNSNMWIGKKNSYVEYSFDGLKNVSKVRLVFDSDLNRKGQNMPCYYSLDQEPYKVPEVMVKDFRIDIKDANGNWITCKKVVNNYQRLVKLDLSVEATAVRFIPEETWGSEEVHVFSFDVE